jgi:hypothetical protein
MKVPEPGLAIKVERCEMKQKERVSERERFARERRMEFVDEWMVM